KDVFRLKRLLKKYGSHAHVIAKIEKPQAIESLDEIILASDGVMIARGDLGIEMSIEKVPFIQKDIIEKCKAAGKPVIVATQMLESMIKEPIPTRAEVSDVANAVLDGTDAIMLSGETAKGQFPVEAFLEMSKIAEEAEKQAFSSQASDKVVLAKRMIQQAVGHAACHLAKDVFAKAIVTFTDSGSSALTISKFRPTHRIFGITPSINTLRRLRLYYGVCPLMIEKVRHTDDMIVKSEKALLSTGQVFKGDLLVIVAGVPTGKPGTTNLIKAHRLGEYKTLEFRK
ncbi:MAG: pyruvate kinase, partial [Candidatus Margulisbacteria bacterium]|nr:pyruvate kinase [Candidatus Margulisiibacteriota bacterium]